MEVIEGITIISLEELASRWQEIHPRRGAFGRELQVTGTIIPGSLVYSHSEDRLGNPRGKLAWVLAENDHHALVYRQSGAHAELLLPTLRAAEANQTLVRCIGNMSDDSHEILMPVLYVGYHVGEAERVHTAYHPKNQSTALQRT